jgi:hypothetical protein
MSVPVVEVDAAPLVEVTTVVVSPGNPPRSSSAVLPPHAASAVPAATSQVKPCFAIFQNASSGPARNHHRLWRCPRLTAR